MQSTDVVTTLAVGVMQLTGEHNLCRLQAGTALETSSCVLLAYCRQLSHYHDCLAVIVAVPIAF